MRRFCYCLFLRDRSNPEYELLDSIWENEEDANKQKAHLDDEPYEGPLYFIVERRIFHTKWR